jgi:hypothetical protein
MWRKVIVADIDVIGRLPELVVFRNKSQMFIKCEIVDQSASGPQPSGRTIHLGLTAEDAMRLLTLLKAAQQQLGLPDSGGPVTTTPVPPAKDRN